jgi:hypothetical protein
LFGQDFITEHDDVLSIAVKLPEFHDGVIQVSGINSPEVSHSSSNLIDRKKASTEFPKIQRGNSETSP